MRKGLDNIRTVRNQVTRFRAQTPYGALIGLAQLAQEKDRLHVEKSNWEKRIQKIQERFREIAEMEEWLRAFADRDLSVHAPEQSSENKNSGNPSRRLPPGFTEVTVKY